jgi:pilus assembly protein Flp/PilA
MAKRFLNDERGVTAIEYAVIAALIFVVIVTGVGALGGNVSGMFNTISANFAGAGGG